MCNLCKEIAAYIKAKWPRMYETVKIKCCGSSVFIGLTHDYIYVTVQDGIYIITNVCTTDRVSRSKFKIECGELDLIERRWVKIYHTNISQPPEILRVFHKYEYIARCFVINHHMLGIYTLTKYRITIEPNGGPFEKRLNNLLRREIETRQAALVALRALPLPIAEEIGEYL